MRIRTIKPTFFLNDSLADCSPLARLLFIGLWCAADIAGRLEERPKRLKAEVLPYDKTDVLDLLNELEKHGFIIRYSGDGVKIIQIANFRKHQRITGTEAESQSVFPEPVTQETNTVSKVETSNDASLDDRKEGRKGREGKEVETLGNISTLFPEPESCTAGAVPASKIDDDAWIESLRQNPAYVDLDIKKEFERMVAWCDVNRKKPTRRRFINWINRCDRPMKTESKKPYVQPI